MTRPVDPSAPRRGTWNRASLWLSIGVVGVVAVLVVVGIIYSAGHHATAGSSPRATVAASADTGGSGRGCHGPSTTDTTVPADLKWNATLGLAWPSSPSLGPTETTNGLPTCWAHSPVGAALAATTMGIGNIFVGDVKTVVSTYDAPSLGRDVALRDASSASASESARELLKAGATLAGFVIDNYSSTAAQVEVVVAIPGSSTGYRTAPVPLVWQGGDWKLLLHDDGTTGNAGDVNSGQFVKWTSQ